MSAPTTFPFVFYQSPLLAAYSERLIHGFTGKPLTLGGADWSPDVIAANRQRLCEAVGLDFETLVLPRQIHSDRFCINLDGIDEPCDAVIVTEPGQTAMVQVADCVPVLLYDPERHAGAAIHAGWRGTAQQIAAKVARLMIETYGCEPGNIRAVVGPAIGGCCYEVSDEVVTAVSETVPDVSPESFISFNAGGRPQLDLKTVNRLQLDRLGIRHIDVLPPCTRCLPESLWSYRRQETGRQVGFLALK